MLAFAVPGLTTVAQEASGSARIIPGVIADKRTGDLAQMREHKVVRALVTFSRTDFFLDGADMRGVQAELLQLYEKQLNKNHKKGEIPVRVVFVPVTFDQLIPSLLEGRGDIAAAVLTVTPEREKLVEFASGRTIKVDELVVASKDINAIASPEDLSGRTVYVLRASSYVEHLRALNAQLLETGRAPIDIQEADANLLTEDILELVNAGVVDITVSDDYKAKLWAQVLPNIVVGHDVKVHTGGTVGWAVRKDNPELLASLNEFFKANRRGTTTGNILFKRYYENTRWVANPIAESERQRLDTVIELFQRYGDEYDFDWFAVAAQAYQESGLDHGARSPAGAVGIMQMLPSTAADPNVGIADIDSLENNIHAGVKYLAFLRKRYFSGAEIAPEDRLAFSWAAYNAGPAKVRKMRAKAEKMGLDSNKWFNNVEYAAAEIVGRETVRYVANVYKYYVAYSLISDIHVTKNLSG